jgi:hypothetical protein
MKKIIVCCLLFVVCSITIAQNKFKTKEEKLQQLKTRRDIKVTEIEKDILRLEYPNGKVIYESIGDFGPDKEKRITYSPTYDSTIIDLRSIDTSLYYQKYSFWQEVNVGTDHTKPPLVGDLNKNGKSEIYGQIKDFTDINPGDNVIMEMNA